MMNTIINDISNIILIGGVNGIGKSRMLKDISKFKTLSRYYKENTIIKYHTYHIKYYQKLLNILKILDPRLKTVSINPKNESILFTDYKNITYNLEELGIHLERLVKHIGFLLSDDFNDFILIDDIFLGINYKILPKLWKLVQYIIKNPDQPSYPSRLYCTTSSLNVVKSFINLKDINYYEMYVCKKSKKRSYDCKNRELLKYAFDAGMEVI